MVYASSPQQRFEMYLGCHKTSFQMVCSFWSPACSPAASADATLDWSSLETVFPELVMLRWTNKEFGSFVRCAKLGKKYLNASGQVLTELRECLQFRSKKNH